MGRERQRARGAQALPVCALCLCALTLRRLLMQESDRAFIKLSLLIVTGAVLEALA